MTKGKQWKDAELALDAIGLHPDLQVRVDGLSPTHLRKLMRTIDAGGDTWGPVWVARIGKALYLVDGHHRLEAHKRVGRETITAKVARMSLGEAKEAARLANTKHGKSLNRADVERVWQSFVADGQHLASDGRPKPSREIAAELGQVRSHEWVRGKLKALGVFDEEVEYPNGYKPYGGGDTEEDLEEALAEDLEAALRNFGARFGQLPRWDQERLLKAAQGMLAAIERGEEPNMSRLLQEAAPF